MNYEKEYAYDLTSVDDLNILEKYNPVIAACIAQNRDMHPRDILALLVDMVNRKILDMDVIKKLNEKTGKEEITYKLRKNKDFFAKAENLEKIDDIEREILNIFFQDSQEIDLENKLSKIKTSKSAMNKIQRLDELVTDELDKLGANFVRVPRSLLILNNVIFIFCMIYILAVVAFNSVLGFSTLSTSIDGIEKLMIMLIVPAICIVFGGFYIALLIIRLAIYIFTVIKSKLNKLSFKLTSKKFTQTIIRIVIMSVILFTAESLLASKSYIVISTMLFIMVLTLVLTDNLMTSHSYKIRNEYVYLKSIEEKIRYDSLLDEKKIEDQILWGKYLSFAIALGVGSISKLANLIPWLEYMGDMPEKLADLYEKYYSDRSDETIKKLIDFNDKISKVCDSISSSGGGFSGGSSSFGGGGFSGGGRRWPEDEGHFNEYIYKTLTICKKWSKVYIVYIVREKKYARL